MDVPQQVGPAALLGAIVVTGRQSAKRGGRRGGQHAAGGDAASGRARPERPGPGLAGASSSRPESSRATLYRNPPGPVPTVCRLVPHGSAYPGIAHAPAPAVVPPRGCDCCRGRLYLDGAGQRLRSDSRFCAAFLRFWPGGDNSRGKLWAVTCPPPG